MDPFAHTFTGAALAASGLRKVTPLATAALLLGVNAPDIDILVSYAGDYMSLAHRRGWTHGVLAWAVLPLALTALLLAWDRGVRRRRRPEAEPARALPLLGLSTLAVLSHPALDWLNNYGIRLLMPFDDRWFYGDALFIIDPWVWLLAGGASFLLWSRNGPALLGWLLVWGGASALVLGNDMVPDSARWLWCLGLAALPICRLAIPPAVVPRVAAAALVVMAGYMAANAVASLRAEGWVRIWLAANGHGEVRDLMVGPVPANPLRGQVVVATAEGYRFGHWHWLADGEKLTLNGHYQPRNLADPASRAAAMDVYARRFLTWSRFPFAVVEAEGDGYRVTFGDARYLSRDGGLRGPTVSLDGALRIVAAQ